MGGRRRRFPRRHRSRRRRRFDSSSSGTSTVEVVPLRDDEGAETDGAPDAGVIEVSGKLPEYSAPTCAKTGHASRANTVIAVETFAIGPISVPDR